jgi:hypothetical protein
VHGDFFSQSSFATHAIARERNVVKVRKDAPLELLGPLGCGVQTGAGAILNDFRLRPGRSLAGSARARSASPPSWRRGSRARGASSPSTGIPRASRSLSSWAQTAASPPAPIP